MAINIPFNSHWWPESSVVCLRVKIATRVQNSSNHICHWEDCDPNMLFKQSVKYLNLVSGNLRAFWKLFRIDWNQRQRKVYQLETIKIWSLGCFYVYFFSARITSMSKVQFLQYDIKPIEWTKYPASATTCKTTLLGNENDLMHSAPHGSHAARVRSSNMQDWIQNGRWKYELRLNVCIALGPFRTKNTQKGSQTQARSHKSVDANGMPVE